MPKLAYLHPVQGTDTSSPQRFENPMKNAIDAASTTINGIDLTSYRQRLRNHSTRLSISQEQPITAGVLSQYKQPVP